MSEAQLLESGLRISIQKYTSILRQLRIEMDDAFLGFLSKPVPTEAFHVFCNSLPGCRNLDELIQNANQFYHLFSDDFHWYILENERQVSLSVDVNQVLLVDYRFIIQSLLLMAIRLFGWLLGEELEIMSVRFSFAQQDTDNGLTYLFGNQILYESGVNALTFHRSYRDVRLSCTKEQVAEMLHQKRHLFFLSRNCNPLTHRVRTLLISGRDNEWLEVEDIAERLGLNPNLLWRKLRKEGTSFLNIRDEIKRDWALALLEDPVNSIEKVSEELRYCDESAFRKAFKNWTGMSPSKYRSLL